MINAKKILIKAKKEVFTEISGNNLSLFKGEGYDFANLREYEFGDDVRKIDWNVTAKMGTPYVKEFIEERELSVVMAFMLGGSVYFGTKKFKQELIAEIAALVGFSVIKNSDRLTGYIFADKLYNEFKPSKKTASVNTIVEAISSFEPLNKSSNYPLLVKELYLKTKRKSIIFIIADFVGDIDLSLISKKHEVILVIVRDRFEDDPQPLGFVGMIDPSSGESLEGDLNEYAIKGYKKAMKANDDALIAHCKKHRIRFSKIYTDDIVFVKLLKLFGGTTHG